MASAPLAASGVGPDVVSLGLGSGANDTEGGAYRAALRWNWGERPAGPGRSVLTGYWEAGVGYLEDTARLTPKEVTTVALALGAVVRWCRPARGARLEPFVDLAAGLHLLTPNALAATLQFSPALGAGVLFGPDRRFEVGYRFLHLSNGGWVEPNRGFDYHLLRFAVRP